MDKLIIEPLNIQQYTETFQVFMHRTHEYEYMIDFLVNELNRQEKQLRILSIGAGTGCFDRKVIEQLKIKPIYTAIEPNPVHVEELKKALPDTNIIQDYFTLTYNTKEKYDYILFTHCLYCISEPAAIVNYATNFLNENGKVIVFHQSEIGMFEFVNEFNKYLTFNEKPFANHTISAKDIMKQLNGKLHCNNHRLDCYIDMSDVFNDKEILHKMLSFFMQTNTKKLPDKIINEMIDELKSGMCVDNKYIHPTDVLVITS